MKKVLIISYVYPPASAPGAIRVSAFARLLPQSSWGAMVLTSDGGYSSTPSNRIDKDLDLIETHKVKDASWKTASASAMGGTAIKKKGGLKSFIGKLARQTLFPDRDVTWIKPAISYALQKMNKGSCSAIISSSPTISNHIVGMNLSRAWGVPLIADFRDHWTLYKLEATSSLRFWRERRLERQIFQQASAVLVVSRSIQEGYRKVYPEFAHKFHVVYNGYDERLYTETLLQTSPVADEYRVVYAGSFYGGRRNPLPFLKALRCLKERKGGHKVRLRVIGRQEEEVLEMVKSEGVEDQVVFTGFLPYEDCIRELAAAHAYLTISILDEGSVGEMTTKLFEYLPFQRPVIGMISPRQEIWQALHECPYGCPVDMTNGNSAHSLAKLLYELSESQSAPTEPSCWHEKFSRKAGAQELAKILDSVVN